MYDNFKILNYNNSLVSPELFARHLSRLFPGNVIDGLTVVPKTGRTVTLQGGNGLIPYGTGATASAREFSLVADFDIALDTADASNPRIDLIVVYVDMGVSLPGGTPTTANLDGPGVVKATFVKGTPNASPVDPTVGAIQTKIGASNPYMVVAAVRVDAGVTTIAAGKITDRRTMAKLNLANDAQTVYPVDVNGWTVATNGLGKKVYTKKVSQAMSLPNGVSFANYAIATTPADVGSNLANYNCAFAVLMPGGSRHISTSIMYSTNSIELGAINLFTGGNFSGTAIVTLTITEA